MESRKKKFSRITAFIVVVAVIFVALISKLVDLQIIQGNYYSTLAQSIGEKTQSIPAVRGEILDRNGKILAANQPSYDVVFNFSYLNNNKIDINTSLVNLLNMLYKDGDQSKIVTNSFPISYDPTTKTFSYNFPSSNNYQLVSQVENFKKANKVKTTFDNSFDTQTLSDFQTSLNNINDDNAKAKAIADFEKKYLTGFNSSLDAKEALYGLAENYKLVSLNSSGNIVYNYKELSGNIPELVNAVNFRYTLQEAQYKQYEGIDIAKNIKQQTAWELSIDSSKVPGITTQVEPLRYYPNGEIGSAFLGYLGRINSNNADKYASMGYDVNNDLVGVSGLEYALENGQNNEYGISLRGKPGSEYIQVDNKGNVVSQNVINQPVPGDNVETTIDENIQAAAEKALDDTMTKIRTGGFSEKGRATRGATVVMDIHTGEILALVSRPGFNPNDFAATGSPQDPAAIKKYLLDNPKELSADTYDTIPRPLFNYATQGAVMPGSTFKPLTAIAGLQEGVITRTSTVFDTGLWDKIPGIKIKEWTYDSTGHGFGLVNVEQALEYSANYFFDEVGYRLGFERLAEWAGKFGLTRVNGKAPSTGIEIPESPGNVGTPQQSIARSANTAIRQIIDTLQDYSYGGYTIDDGSVYYTEIYNMLLSGNYDVNKLNSLGITNVQAQNYIKFKVNYVKKYAINQIDVLNMAIGQGFVSLTPLQMAQYLSTLLNGGTRYKAHLVKAVLNPDGTIKEQIKPEVMSKITLDPKNIQTIMAGMGDVTQEPGGTANYVFGNYPIKTGGKTGTAQPGVGEITKYRDNYGWYLSFAPYDNPQIVVATVIYDGAHGIYAANVAKAIYDVYFQNDPRMKTYLAKQNAQTKK